MMSNNLLFLLVGFIFLWLGILTFFLFRTIKHYQKLTEGIEKKHLQAVLEKILKDLGEKEKQIKKLLKQVEKLEKENLYNIQKIGLVRFNPFAEVGGDQSFSLAILDGENSGLVISSLHSREVTRIYAKPVKKGKAVGYQLSTEEIQAIKNARKID
jgi:cell division protein FtsB